MSERRWPFSRVIRTVKAHPAHELVALSAEPSWWKRALRFVWCAFLILTGHVAYVTYEQTVQVVPEPAAFQYDNPFTSFTLVLLQLVRAPPALA